MEDAFFVGSCRGDFVGYIDRTSSGRYRGFDSMSRPRGETESLSLAMAELGAWYFATNAEGAADAH